MYTIKRTEAFTDWFDGIKDGQTRGRLAARLRKATLGNLGDIRPVGEGVFEMREHFGPGWRMYCIQRGTILIVMATNPRNPPISPRPSNWPQPWRIEHDQENQDRRPA